MRTRGRRTRSSVTTRTACPRDRRLVGYPGGVFLEEHDAASYAFRIGRDMRPIMSAAGALETSIVLRGRKRMSVDDAEAWLDEFLTVGGIEVEPVTIEHARIARITHMRFGKGTGHPARLNFGDCFAYALAKATGAPLLFKGEDFARTDIENALSP